LTWPSREVSFSVHAGELVGIAGLVGAGRSELLESIFGIVPPLAGEVLIADQQVRLSHCRHAIAAGMALVPEDRKQQGLILEQSIRHNIALPGLSRHQRWGGFLNFSRAREDTARMIGQLRIKAADDQQPVQYLSGGNQQKVVIAKWLAVQPAILLLDEPTRGVDIGAKQEIYRLMEELAGRGVAVLFVSSEMEEVLSMSDRVLVMHEGRLSGELNRSELSEQAIMQLATGYHHS
jgi:ribose transport system ATP-binding protein